MGGGASDRRGNVGELAMNVGVLALVLVAAGAVVWSAGAALRAYAWAQVDELRVRGLLDHSFATMHVGAAVFFMGVGVVLALEARG